MFRWLMNALHDPLTKDMNLDAPERLDRHAQVLAQQPLLRDIQKEFHRLFLELDHRFLYGSGLAIEIGAGSTPMGRNAPHVLSTDVLDGPRVDRVVDAQNMDFKAGSVRTIFGVNCFHHFSQPDLFLSELERVLVPGGGAILLEPYTVSLQDCSFVIFPQPRYSTGTPRDGKDQHTAP